MNHFQSSHRVRTCFSTVASSILFLSAGLSCGTIAQTTSSVGNGNIVRTDEPVARSAPEVNAAPYNAFADNLKPKAKRTSTIQNQPYQPIKKPSDQEQIAEIDMFVGESRVFPTPNVARIAVGNGQILSAAALDNKEVILFANGAGTSSLFVWSEDGRYQRIKINIVPGDTSRIAREIAAFLATIPNAKSSIIGDKVIVEGDDLSDQELVKIDEMAKRYPQIVNFTNRLGWEQMVMMDVKVVEFPVDELRELGLKWNASGGAAIGGIWSPGRRGDMGGLQINIPGGSGNSLPITSSVQGSSGVPLPHSLNILSALNLGLNAHLNLLAQNGKATILAEPQLSARNGSKASFLAGGEFPYTVSNLNGVSVIFKPYGIKLDIHPRVDRNGVIRATIDSEVSKIDASVSTTGGPALLTRRTNTEFNLRGGETMVLSGLVQVDSSTSIDKVPFLGDVPVLGALFRSKRFQNKETELVVFVTPTIVDSNSRGLVERVEKVKERLEQNLGNAPYLRAPLQPGVDPANVSQTTKTKSPAPALIESTASAEKDSQAAPASQATPLLEPVSASHASNAVPVKKYRVTVDKLALRAAPDTSSPIMSRLEKNTLVDVQVESPQSNWYPVQIGGKQGWVASHLLSAQ